MRSMVYFTVYFRCPVDKPYWTTELNHKINHSSHNESNKELFRSNKIKQDQIKSNGHSISDSNLKSRVPCPFRPRGKRNRHSVIFNVRLFRMVYCLWFVGERLWTSP